MKIKNECYTLHSKKRKHAKTAALLQTLTEALSSSKAKLHNAVHLMAIQ